MKHDRGYWTRQSIECDKARFEKTMTERHNIQEGDGFPPGMPVEQIGEIVVGDWSDYEPNTYGGS